MPQPGKTFGYFYIHMKVTFGTIFGILKIFEKVGHSAQWTPSLTQIIVPTVNVIVV